jgi:hypothetical protein
VEDITKKLFSQASFLLVGAFLLVISASGSLPLSNPPLPISEPFRVPLFIVGLILLGLGIALLIYDTKHVRKTELNELQFSRLRQEGDATREALAANKELVKEREEYLVKQREEIQKQVETIENELITREESLSEVRQKYALSLLHQKVALEIAERESERIFKEYSENYWALYKILNEQGLIDLNKEPDEIQSLTHDSLQKLYYFQYQNTYALKSIANLQKLLKDPESGK